MRITIAVHGHLQRVSGMGQEEITFVLPDAGGVRIRDLLTSLNVVEEEVKETQLNGRKVRLDTLLHGQMRIDLFPTRQ